MWLLATAQKVKTPWCTRKQALITFAAIKLRRNIMNKMWFAVKSFSFISFMFMSWQNNYLSLNKIFSHYLIIKAAWDTWVENKTNGNDSVLYPVIVACKNCPMGCDNCDEGISCLASISWIFRLVGIITVPLFSPCLVYDRH